MSSLQHVKNNGRDHWKIRIYLNKSRSVIGLGNISQTEAEEALEHIDQLIECLNRSKPPGKLTRQWLDRIPDSLHGRLAELKLCEPRVVRELPNMIIAYCRLYIKSRVDWKKPENYSQAVDKLECFLGKDIPLVALTKGEAERWHRWMIYELKMSPNTAGQNVKRCRQIIRTAVDDGLLERNPFVGIKIDLSSDKSRNRFISKEMAHAMLEACPDQEWRVIFALARFGGLRCPSEVIKLKWSDIQWERGRFKVHSSKTERVGKGERIVPLFPELRLELETLFQMIQPGIETSANSYVITRYRHSHKHLRSTIHRIMDQAGLVRWPKPFIALRASRRTELERSGKFANHVLNDWFGHSGSVADSYYLQTTEDDFLLATDHPGDLLGDPLGIPSGDIHNYSGNVKQLENSEKSSVLTIAEGSGRKQNYTREDLNL